MTEPDGTVAWRSLLAEATTALDGVVASPEVDARRIVEEASGHDGPDWFRALDELVTVRAMARFDAMLARRRAGEPLQYVLGRWGFRHLDLAVDPRVLIPRPETEQVTEFALREVDRLQARRAVDLGTGSGAIALSLAVERDTLEVWATDRSPDALAVARSNLAGLGTAGTRVRLTEGSWFGALPSDLAGSIDVVVSNPPYVADADELPADVADWEPAEALRAGPAGLDDIEHIIAAAPKWLSDRGSLVIELAPDQAEPAIALAVAAGFAEAVVEPDLNGRARALVARWGPR